MISSFLSCLSEDQKEVGVFVLWHIWNDRNTTVFEGRGRDLNFVAKKAFYLLKNYHDAQPPCAISNVSLRAWTPLPQNVHKLNFNATIFSDISVISIGVIRNASGEFLWQLCVIK